MHFDDIYELSLFTLYVYMFRLFIQAIIRAYNAILRVQVKRFVQYLVPSSGVLQFHRIIMFLGPVSNE